MGQIVPYRTRPGDLPTLPKRPWLLVYLGNDPIFEWAIVDSGSSHSLIPPHVADRVGLLYDRTPRTGMGVQPFVYTLATTTITARTEFGQTFIMEPVISTYPGFSILGRHDFFEAFYVAFDQRAGQFEVDRQPPQMGFRARTN